MSLRVTLFKFGLGLVLSLLLVVALFATLLFWMSDPLNLRAPKDEVLLKVFQDHHAAFDRLQQMVREDSANQWYFADSSLKTGKLGKPRQEEYKRLFDSIWPDLSVTVGDDDQVSFCFAGGGILSIGPEWSKGILYMPHDDRGGTIVPNLDKMRTAPADDYIRPIKPDWFLYYQRYDN